jgi:ABC-2 type transport system permease protein
MQLRSREMKLRLLDRSAIRKNRILIQASNILLPVTVVVIAGFIYSFMRKRKYTGKG